MPVTIDGIVAQTNSMGFQLQDETWINYSIYSYYGHLASYTPRPGHHITVRTVMTITNRLFVKSITFWD